MRARGCRQPGVATQSGHGTVPHHTHTHQAKYDRKMKLLRDDLELRRKHELHEVEERKNGHINELMRQHEAAFSEVKNYYNDITANNLDLINLDLNQQQKNSSRSSWQRTSCRLTKSSGSASRPGPTPPTR